GYSTRTYKQVTENGKTTEVLANTSHYIKRDKVVYVGTIAPEKPPETQEGDPEQGEGTKPDGETEPATDAAAGETEE
ncbi:MAG: hypothetical protein ACOYIE_09325, partial [Agathobaculum sp.]|uniref:hypothetical protein n=1 Tax=Agathobaculum sp. TaxID=2048138 RepID=UPI003D9119CB